MLTRVVRRPVGWLALFVLLVATGWGLYWFQPWKLVTDRTVAEAVPRLDGVPAAASRQPVAGPQPDPIRTAAPTATAEPTATGPAGNRLLAAGTFVTHEHDTTGTVQLVRLGDGRRQLVLRGLATSNGPDLRVWLTDQPVLAGHAGWRVFDDGRHLEVSRLRGNRGDQVYDLPADIEVADWRSVSIWCKRFAVSFGAAELTAEPDRSRSNDPQR